MNYQIRESGCRFVVMEAGTCRGCVASREQAFTLVTILEAMAEARHSNHRQEAA